MNWDVIKTRNGSKKPTIIRPFKLTIALSLFSQVKASCPVLSHQAYRRYRRPRYQPHFMIKIVEQLTCTCDLAHLLIPRPVYQK